MSDHLEIRTPSRTLRALVAARTDDADAVAALGGDVTPAPGSWLYGKDVLDLVRLGKLTIDELIDNLRPLQFRDYSIASSPVVYPDAVHLTVAIRRPASRREFPLRRGAAGVRDLGCSDSTRPRLLP
ncbi:putative NADPH--sulfite reductase flavoprotein alpha-component [Mycobacteroides abscessus subsp. abscessus]|nr:putative NADPH--sulfite reductase flavoprotein alpha-component [Mycobacteroides abscessus subsp. abscessus]